MEKFVGTLEMSLADILGFENESDLFNKQAKVCVIVFAHDLGIRQSVQLAVRVALTLRTLSQLK